MLGSDVAMPQRVRRRGRVTQDVVRLRRELRGCRPAQRALTEGCLDGVAHRAEVDPDRGQRHRGVDLGGGLGIRRRDLGADGLQGHPGFCQDHPGDPPPAQPQHPQQDVLGADGTMARLGRFGPGLDHDHPGPVGEQRERHC